MMLDSPPAIHYTVEGGASPAAEVVVLLNGGMMSGFAWEPIAKDLAKDFRVIRLDFRGQLMSPSDAPPADLSSHARDVVSVLDRADVERAHIVGTSFGALVGLVLAAEHPERVRSLVAMTATARLSPEMVAGTKHLRTLARDALNGGDGGKVLDTIVPTTYSPEWIAANQAVLAARRPQVAALPKAWFSGLDALLGALEIAEPFRVLEKIRCPTTVVAGERDVTFPIPNSEELVRGIAGSKLVVIAKAAHGLALENPAESIAAIRQHLAALTAPPSPAPAAPESKEPPKP